MGCTDTYPWSDDHLVYPIYTAYRVYVQTFTESYVVQCAKIKQGYNTLVKFNYHEGEDK